MALDSGSINLSTLGSFANNLTNYLSTSPGGYQQFDPVATNLSSSKDFNALPDVVKLVLNSTGVFSLDPVDGWTKTTLNANLTKLFGKDTIYTPPTSTIDYFNTLRALESNKSQFDDFLTTLFNPPDSIDTSQTQDSFLNTSTEPDPLASLLNFDSYNPTNTTPK